MSERASRFEDLRLTPTQVAALLEVTEDRLARWVAGELETQDADVIEVGIALLEGVHRKPWRDDDFRAGMLVSVDALIG